MTDLSRVGIIGGTGLYSIEGLEILEEKEIETPFGAPSSKLTIGRAGKREVVFLPRHGLKHQVMPSEINFRANIWALKKAGVREIISFSATGSLVEEIKPGDLAIPHQYFDWTKGKRIASFFGNGMVGHISTAAPVCPTFSDQVQRAADQAGLLLHTKKTYACVEGPRLGTRAESFFLKGAGCDLVGMTNVPEVFLAREAQISYCTVAVATDYDCWKDGEEDVTVAMVIERYGEALTKLKGLIKAFCSNEGSESPTRRTLDHALLTPAEMLTPQHRELLEFLKV